MANLLAVDGLIAHTGSTPGRGVRVSDQATRAQTTSAEGNTMIDAR
ncbi:hypothetical protein C497_14412 [Halalkalicoccus jeotgali B3]|uniref:Uncharacterized protein n=1 Tax=Halalkalicoccus jeotgali (strain DSM 18796 / CECT 7217 / JCM 14584 / KCTC 4019 / B3) TaxID=795797 RepID=D8J2T5_HALJB|nr:hypothetical protein HacjB3_08295 [Halalkalicoccus jeotgali B3]ELY34940.1 hypothetical protein C497_14412 [Halalkalicoccus jeotgali B3]